MERIINIGEIPVAFNATASTLTRYRNQYGRDLIEDFAVVQGATQQSTISGEAIDIFVRLAHVMARQADPTISPDPLEWVDRFETFPIREVLIPIVSLWAESLGTTVEAAEKN